MTPIDQDQFVLNETVQAKSEEKDFKTCLDDVTVLRSPACSHFWGRRLITHSGVIEHHTVQRHIKTVLYKRLKSVEEENVDLKKQLKVKPFVNV